MSTETIFFFAIGVFLLMLIGIFLTILEFNRMVDDPSQRKGTAEDTPRPADHETIADA